MDLFAVVAFQQVDCGDGRAWKWGDWISPSFPYLETRPWTPIIIGNRLCFVAADTAKLGCDSIARKTYENARWCVVWGEKAGPWFDDVHGLSEHKTEPIYIARKDNVGSHDYCIVWGNRRSTYFSNQISFRCEEERVFVLAFDSKGRSQPGDEVRKWLPL